jgi:hypothetical protein
MSEERVPQESTVESYTIGRRFAENLSTSFVNYVPPIDMAYDSSQSYTNLFKDVTLSPNIVDLFIEEREDIDYHWISRIVELIRAGTITHCEKDNIKINSDREKITIEITK